MTGDVITVLAVVAGIVWLGLMVVSAFRNRGGAEEVAPNLKPGIDDQHLETRRLEKGQKAAIAFSAFLAISLPLYFLGETNRQEGFVEEFDEASVERGLHIVEEFACYSCHGPLGSGGAATFVEKRSGVTVSWEAPSLDDIFYRYDGDEVNFWVTFGRGNTPMPAWGLAGGGPLNEKQVEDVVNYLRTIQIDQQAAVDETVDALNEQRIRLETADATVETAILNQRQVVAEIDQAPGDLGVIEPLAEKAAELLENAGSGIDTDGDGLADAVETELTAISAAAIEHFQALDPPVLDPETADADLLDQGLETLAAQQPTDPILAISIDAIAAAVAEDEITEENPDTDSDGISDAGERTINGLFDAARTATIPRTLTPLNLDPTNDETTVGQRDRRAASNFVGALESVTINLGVTVENEDRIRSAQEGGLEFLEAAAAAREWEIDIGGVAAAMEVSEEEALRAVTLFNANCARCHTAGFSAGVPYTKEAGSGGFGPALWDGRPIVQFGEAPAGEGATDLLVDFLIKGSEAQAPYGLNGFGSGRMPGFGAILDPDDIDLLARYLRSGNLNGME